MGLKQIIQRSQMFNREGVEAELVLPEEPNIYSVRMDISKRYYSVQFFRNMKFRSILKCYFQSYLKTQTPVVIIVRFYVSAPSSQKITKSELKSERVPAAMSFELCDYLLSFLEMLHHVLFNSYRQVVKIEMDKFYSDNPRTVFKFMSWANYVIIQNSYSPHAAPKSKNNRKQPKVLHPDRQGDSVDQEVRGETDRECPAAEGLASNDSPLCHPCAT